MLQRAQGLMVLLAACGSSSAQTNCVSVPLESKHGHIMVPARVSGSNSVLPIKIKSSTPVVEAAIKLPGGALIRGEFEIDTGCDGGLCLGHDFVEANKLLEARGPIEGGVRSGVGGDAETKVGSVPQLQLGGLTVEKPEANFFLRGSPVDLGHAGHIGLGALRQFRIIFDYSREQVILKPRSQKSAAEAT